MDKLRISFDIIWQIWDHEFFEFRKMVIVNVPSDKLDFKKWNLAWKAVIITGSVRNNPISWHEAFDYVVEKSLRQNPPQSLKFPVSNMIYHFVDSFSILINEFGVILGPWVFKGLKKEGGVREM